jgi:hypothetical protein
MNFFLNVLVTSLFLLGGMLAQAEEVDDFSPVTGPAKDAAPIINSATNALLDELVELLNKSDLSGCDDPKKYQLALKKLDQNFTAIGNGLRAGPELRQLLTRIGKDPQNQSKHLGRLVEVQNTWLAEFPLNQREWFTNLFSSIDYFGPRETKGSIYDGLSLPTCCTARLNINGIYLGLDKVDHFFGNGGLLFEEFQASAGSSESVEARLERIMKINVRQEHTLWGLKGLSPKSYGDLAANWQGIQFYRRLFDESPRYLDCRQGRFQRHPRRLFAIQEYMDESWNEATNCSSFASQADLDQFRKNLRKAGMQCPVKPEVCKKLVAKHKADPLFTTYALSPLCGQPDKAFTPVEEAIPISWEEADLSFRGFTLPIIRDLAKKKLAEVVRDLVPDILWNRYLEESQTVFTQLRQCLQSDPKVRNQCLRQYTEAGLEDSQLLKFGSLGTEGVQFSSLQSCPGETEQMEQKLHPKPLGDLHFCFTTKHYRHKESLGQIFFRRHEDGLKAVLLRY